MKTSNTISPEAIRESFDYSNGYLLITDAHSHILYASKALENNTGYLTKEIIGKNPGKLWGGHMSKAYYQNMWQILSTKKIPFVGEVENLKKNSSKVKATIHIAPLTDSKGNIKYYLAIQPNFKKPNQAKKFRKEFTDYLKNHHHLTGHFLQQLWQWLLDDTKYRKHLVENLIKNLNEWNAMDTVSMIEKIFISAKDQLQINDETMVQNAQMNPQLYSALYEKYRKKIFDYFFYHLGRDKALAEDLTEETFSRALIHLQQFQITHHSYFSYLLATAHNILVNYYRSSKSISLENIPNLSLEEAFPLMRKMEIALLWQKIKSLQQTEQRILMMKYRDDLSIASIAKALNKSENAIKLTLSRARRKLRAIAL